MNPTNLGKGLLVVGAVMLVLAMPLSMVATFMVQGTIDSASVRTAENTWEFKDLHFYLIEIEL